jgi:hypothetical protein
LFDNFTFQANAYDSVPEGNYNGEYVDNEEIASKYNDDGKACAWRFKIVDGTHANKIVSCVTGTKPTAKNKCGRTITALLDESNEIAVLHLKAAYAVWRYVEQSVVSVFGDGDDDAFERKVYAAVVSQPGVSRKELYDAFGRNVEMRRIADALERLKAKGKVYDVKDTSAKGRPAQRWYPTPRPADDHGNDDARTNESASVVASASRNATPETSKTPETPKVTPTTSGVSTFKAFTAFSALGQSDGPTTTETMTETSDVSGVVLPVPTLTPGTLASSSTASESADALALNADTATMENCDTPTTDETATATEDVSELLAWLNEGVTLTPFATPYPELNDLIREQGVTPFVFDNGVRVSFNADADADVIERLRRYDSLTLEKWTPFVGETGVDVNEKRWSLTYRKP